MKGIFLPKWKIVPYNSKPVPILAIKNLPGEHMNRDYKAQDLMTSKEEHVPRLGRLAMQTNIPSGSERMKLVVREEERLVRVEPLL